MSDDAHAPATAQSAHGQEAHGHEAHAGHGHEEPWGAYNAEEPEPSNLKPANPVALAIFGLALAGLLAGLVCYSLHLTEAAQPSSGGGGGEAHKDAGEEHGKGKGGGGH